MSVLFAANFGGVAEESLSDQVVPLGYYLSLG
jgi:hypothetical protein